MFTEYLVRTNIAGGTGDRSNDKINGILAFTEPIDLDVTEK